MSALDQTKLLISLAQIDGTTADREKNLIWNIAAANGLTEAEVFPLFDQRHPLIVPDNLSEDEKFEYLLSLVKLMKVDERMYKEELLFVAKIGSRLGYDKHALGDLLLHVKSGDMSDAEKEKIRELISRYRLP